MKSGKGAVWAAVALGAGWAGWRFVRNGEDPTRRLAGTFGAGAILLFVAEINEQMAGALAWLVIVGAIVGNVGSLPAATTEGNTL